MSAASYEAPPEAFEMQEVTNEDIPLMPLVIKTLFISNATGENLSNVRKLLYKVRGHGITSPVGASLYSDLYRLHPVLRPLPLPPSHTSV